MKLVGIMAIALIVLGCSPRKVLYLNFLDLMMAGEKIEGRNVVVTGVLRHTRNQEVYDGLYEDFIKAEEGKRRTFFTLTLPNGDDSIPFSEIDKKYVMVKGTVKIIYDYETIEKVQYMPNSLGEIIVKSIDVLPKRPDHSESVNPQ